MKKLSYLSACALLMTTSVSAKLTIHDMSYERFEKKPDPSVEGFELPENISVKGRGHSQKLESTIKLITSNKMNVRFINPEIKDMKISWRASDEPLQVVLTRIGRQNDVDFTINETMETIYVANDNGFCTPHREKLLNEISSTWKKFNLDGTPVLPSLLKIQTDLAGYNFKLC